MFACKGFGSLEAAVREEKQNKKQKVMEQQVVDLDEKWEVLAQTKHHQSDINNNNQNQKHTHTHPATHNITG